MLYFKSNCYLIFTVSAQKFSSAKDRSCCPANSVHSNKSTHSPLSSTLFQIMQILMRFCLNLANTFLSFLSLRSLCCTLREAQLSFIQEQRYKGFSYTSEHFLLKAVPGLGVSGKCPSQDESVQRGNSLEPGSWHQCNILPLPGSLHSCSDLSVKMNFFCWSLVLM